MSYGSGINYMLTLTANLAPKQRLELLVGEEVLQTLSPEQKKAVIWLKRGTFKLRLFNGSSFVKEEELTA